MIKLRIFPIYLQIFEHTLIQKKAIDLLNTVLSNKEIEIIHIF